MLAVLLMSIIPQPMLCDTVDRVEVNHVYDGLGQSVFSQIIWSDWSAIDGRFQVRAWRLIKVQAIVPKRRGGYWVSRWLDGGKRREVRAKQYRETWTQHDPELLEREMLPKKLRTGLAR